MNTHPTLTLSDRRGGSKQPWGSKAVSRHVMKVRRWPPGGKRIGGHWTPSWPTNTRTPSLLSKLMIKNLGSTGSNKEKRQRTHKPIYAYLIGDSEDKQYLEHRPRLWIPSRNCWRQINNNQNLTKIKLFCWHQNIFLFIVWFWHRHAINTVSSCFLSTNVVTFVRKFVEQNTFLL